MLKYITIAVLCCLNIGSQAQIKIPALSPSAETVQNIGLTTCNISYARPSLRGRSLYGDRGILIKGDKWRTGANAVTTFEFSSDVEINGSFLPKGKYVVLSTPSKTMWAFHFYPYEPQPYTYFLDKKPLINISTAVGESKEKSESLIFYFDDINLESAKLFLKWEMVLVELSIVVKEHENILANIERALKGPSTFEYFQAALYLHEKGKDLEKALEYIQKVTERKDALFFQVYREALILRDLKRNEEAITAAKRAKRLSEIAGNQDLVRLSQHIIEDLEK